MDLQKTRFKIAGDEIHWFDWCRNLLDLYTTEKTYVANELTSCSYLTIRKWILQHKMTGSDLLLRNMLLDAMLSADRKTPGAEVYVPWFLYDHDRYMPVRGSSQEYLDATLSRTKSEDARNIFKEIHNVVGPLTKIILKHSYEHETVIKYRNSFSFPLQLDQQFHRMIGHVEDISMASPIVVMIEGAPETVAEINSLLQWNHEKSRPVLLIARSFPEEISATLATNWLRGSLNILPVPYGDKLESINLAADMCAITGGELISAHFGDVIAASILEEDKWGEVDKLEWSNFGLSLYKNANVDRHVRNLITKLKNIEEEEIQNMYRDRILSLSNDAIEVWINKTDKKLVDELDGMIKHYNGYVTSGMVNTEIGLLPSCFVTSAKDTAESLRQEILNIGGFLVGVKNEMVVS